MSEAVPIRCEFDPPWIHELAGRIRERVDDLALYVSSWLASSPRSGWLAPDETQEMSDALLAGLVAWLEDPGRPAGVPGAGRRAKATAELAGSAAVEFLRHHGVFDGLAFAQRRQAARLVSAYFRLAGIQATVPGSGPPP